MSLSKEHILAAADYEKPSQPKCTRCRHHGIIVPKKGHMKYCPFLQCDCWKCYLITQRTQISTLQRNLKKAQTNPQKKEQRPSAPKCVSVETPPAAVEGTCTASDPGGGARPSGGATERAAWSPLDLRSRPAARGENVAGVDSGKLPPCSSSEEGSSYAPRLGEFTHTAPPPVIHFPFTMSGHYPSCRVPCPNLLLNMPLLPPVPAGLYNDGLFGPLMFPHFHLGAVHYPPPPEAAADRGPVFFTLQPPPLPEPLQEELMQPQPPLSTKDT
ncbi:doublesex- and mab-3-related transcription factor B1-like [Morone saxatilis]|uniref:doublesex- and mab-3-related transcription factor B1-like n=1 Tax=Morone saxatilis TaxID=34816 RepID=UPI0015E23548|nr:doublesex- and mab-3-related transcription factor B1-like [Morone saxatilis]